jgi:hypothetical protein
MCNNLRSVNTPVHRLLLLSLHPDLRRIVPHGHTAAERSKYLSATAEKSNQPIAIARLQTPTSPGFIFSRAEVFLPSASFVRDSYGHGWRGQPSSLGEQEGITVQHCAFCEKPIKGRARKFCTQRCRYDAWRKAAPPAVRQAMGVPHCKVCGKPMQGATQLIRDHQQGCWNWARKFCSHVCRQAAFRAAKG